MPGSDWSRLLRDRAEIDLPGGEHEAAARRLAELGLLRLEDRMSVRCIDSLDQDQAGLQSRSCPGRIYLHPDLDEHDHVPRCPACGRVIQLEKKQVSRSLRLYTEPRGIRDFVKGLIEALGLSCWESPPGLIRVLCETEVQVCVAELFQGAALPVPQEHQPIIYVVLDEGNGARRRGVPKEAPRYLLAELALGAPAPFQQRIRALAGRMITRLTPADPSRRSPAGRSVPAPHLRAPAGTTWTQITFYYSDNFILVVRVGDRRPFRMTCADLGLESLKSREPQKQWKLLAEAVQHGAMARPRVARELDAVKRQVSALRQTLSEAFGPAGDPFEYDREVGWRPRFRVEPYPPGGGDPLWR